MCAAAWCTSSTSKPDWPWTIWWRMPPILPPITALPFHIASETVSPNPSRSDFCSTTAARRCKALTKSGSSAAIMMMRSPDEAQILSYMTGPSGSSVAVLPIRTKVAGACSDAMQKASMTPCGSFHLSNRPACTTSGRSRGMP